MSNEVIKVTKATLMEMKQYYDQDIQAKQPQGSVFVVKQTNCTITAYNSGKVLFQGSMATVEAKKWGKAEEKQAKTSVSVSDHSYSPPSGIKSMSIIGSDEVGTGDYFGPITVCATFVSSDQITLLQEFGVKDSKNLTDPQITNIAKQIIPILPHSLLILHNEKYNDIQEKGYSQGKMKALLHNQAINHLVKKLTDISKVDGVLIDQFELPSTYFKHISGKNQDFNGPIYFSTKAEGVHLAVAAASIIARHAFVTEFDKLSEQAGFPLQKGAGPKVDEIAAKLMRKHGEKALRTFTKLHFANTVKAKKRL